MTRSSCSDWWQTVHRPSFLELDWWRLQGLDPMCTLQARAVIYCIRTRVVG